MKRIRIFFVLILVFSTSFSVEKSPKALKIKKVVIDAGHGGHDPGAVGKKFKEKDIALSVVLKLGNLIKANYPDIEVIYTRKTDVFVELYRRAQIANLNHADIFISIHCNSTKTPDPNGAETWVLGLNKSQANLEVAKKENAAILLESDYATQYDGFDPNSPEGNIIFSLYQNAYLDQSLIFADMVQKQFTNKLGRFDRGVKQAGFLVLYKTTMPGALIELGFISNPKEEDFLGSENGQIQLSNAIYRAFRDYKNKYEGTPTAITDTNSINLPEVLPVSDTAKNIQISDLNNSDKKDVFFRVQFFTSPTPKPSSSAEFKGLPDVKSYVQQKTYKFTSGNFTTLNEAVAHQHKVQTVGFKDAFVVAFLNELRITPSEAVKIINSLPK